MIEYLKEHYDFDIEFIVYESYNLYNLFHNNKVKYSKTIEELINEYHLKKYNKPCKKDLVQLTIMVDSDDDNEVILPDIKYRFHK
jgi:hypothetical protein